MDVSPPGPISIRLTKPTVAPRLYLYFHYSCVICVGIFFLLFFFQDDNRHVGDLGNVEADASGVAKFEITDCLVKVGLFYYFSTFL